MNATDEQERAMNESDSQPPDDAEVERDQFDQEHEDDERDRPGTDAYGARF